MGDAAAGEVMGYHPALGIGTGLWMVTRLRGGG